MNKSQTESSPRWGMTFDLTRCVGCQTCTVSCKDTNATAPGIKWRNVLDIENGTFPNVQREFLVVGCQHCAEPTCVPVCPSGATKQRADGLVTMDYDLCIGCGYCAVACPYQARTIAHEKDWYYESETAQEKATAQDERIGVAQKCTFCVDRIDEAADLGLTPGIDLNYTPACVASCITQALQFGDFNDSESNVSKLTQEKASFQMHQELGNDPQIKYLYEIDTTPGRDFDQEDSNDEIMSSESNPLVGQKQTFWDYRAAMNFTLGGMSSALMVLATLAYFFYGLEESSLITVYSIAGAMMAIGLFFIFLEISRKMRFLSVLLRPQSSWMTRETYVVAIVFPALVAEFLWPSIYLHIVIAISGFAFLYCQAQILFAAKGIPAWRAPLIPWLLVSTGFLEATGLLALYAGIFPEKMAFTNELATLGMAFGIITGALWITYRRTAKSNGIPVLARRVINKSSGIISLLGHAVPVFGFSYLLNQSDIGRHPMLLIGLGLSAVIGGIIWKFTVITNASFTQGFALPKIPGRGSGTRAAPYRDGFHPAK